MGAFLLVHGAWHGASCWERLVPKLEAAGHHVAAVTLPGDDPTATFEDYAHVVIDEMGADPDGVVLVGHSLGGLTIPLVAARRHVARLVYLCALVPLPGSSFIDQLGIEADTLDFGYLDGLGEPDAEGRRAWTDRELARQFLYADCDDESADAALDRLRPQSQSPYAVPCALESFPVTPATYIVCHDDRLVKPDWSMRVARERLDADLIELPGSHSPFWSRPEELAAVLTDLV
jgi:pimeloyl-ACP methyl ester carboxylesterase